MKTVWAKSVWWLIKKLLHRANKEVKNIFRHLACLFVGDRKQDVVSSTRYVVSSTPYVGSWMADAGCLARSGAGRLLALLLPAGFSLKFDLFQVPIVCGGVTLAP